MAYHCPTTLDGGFTTNDQEDIKQIGLITNITPWDGTQSVVVCDFVLPDGGIANSAPIDGSYILFSKDNAVNVGSISGYYGLARFVNNSTVKGEMFSAACEVFESSK
jgi:hypothetical protein